MACNTNVEYVVIEAEEAPVIVDETPEENNGDIPDEADNNNAEEEKKGEDDEKPEQDAVGESQEIENANNEEQQNDNPDADTVSKIVTKKCHLWNLPFDFLKIFLKKNTRIGSDCNIMVFFRKMCLRIRFRRNPLMKIKLQVRRARNKLIPRR